MRRFTAQEKQGMFTSVRKQRRLGWMIGRTCLIDCEGNHEEANKLVPSYTRDALGNPLLFLTIGIMLIQFAYYAIKLWKELRIINPSEEPLPEFEKGLM